MSAATEINWLYQNQAPESGNVVTGWLRSLASTRAPRP